MTPKHLKDRNNAADSTICNKVTPGMGLIDIVVGRGIRTPKWDDDIMPTATLYRSYPARVSGVRVYGRGAGILPTRLTNSQVPTVSQSKKWLLSLSYRHKVLTSSYTYSRDQITWCGTTVPTSLHPPPSLTDKYARAKPRNFLTYSAFCIVLCCIEHYEKLALWLFWLVCTYLGSSYLSCVRRRLRPYALWTSRWRLANLFISRQLVMRPVSDIMLWPSSPPPTPPSSPSALTGTVRWHGVFVSLRDSCHRSGSTPHTVHGNSLSRMTGCTGVTSSTGLHPATSSRFPTRSSICPTQRHTCMQHTCNSQLQVGFQRVVVYVQHSVTPVCNTRATVNFK